MSGLPERKIEVADIFRRHIGDWLEIYNLPMRYYEVVADIIGCRTEWMGGHVWGDENYRRSSYINPSVFVPAKPSEDKLIINNQRLIING